MQIPHSTRHRRALCEGVVIAALAACCTPALCQTVQVYVSSKSGDRLTVKPPLRFNAKSYSERATFTINDQVAYQTMAGFGASFLEAGMICLSSLLPEDQESVLRALFDPEQGAGFSAMKTVIAGTDFMSAGPWYSYDDTAGDVEMKHFSIERDLGPNGLITYIKRARKYGRFILQAPMDYPPDWMLVDLEKNQDVNPHYYQALARYYVRYLQEYQKNGVSIDYLSLFNEPGIYTKISYPEIRDLLKNYVGPQFAKEGVKTKIQFSESPDRSDAFRNYPVVLDDPEARKYVTNIFYHGYRLQEHEKEKMEYFHQRYPGLPLWQTEICHAYPAGTPREMPLPRLDFEDGNFWGNQIISDIENHAAAWIYWNMILDQKGGPWLVSQPHHDPDNNIQHAVVIIDRNTRKITYTGLYYYLAHFSKFVRPGAARIQTSGTLPGVRCLAFKAKEGRLVVELINSRKTPTDIRLDSHGRALELNLPPVAIVTCLWKSPAE